MAPDEKVTATDERGDFAAQLSRALAVPPPRADDWKTPLWALADRTATGKWVIILDEINWLGAKDATFLGKLKSAGLHFSKNNRLILILSGSLSSWIERNILHSTGFVGRVHLDLTLDELPLRDCVPFLETGHQFSLELREIQDRDGYWRHPFVLGTYRPCIERGRQYSPSVLDARGVSLP